MISVVRDKNKKILKELMLEMIDNYAEIEKLELSGTEIVLMK